MATLGHEFEVLEPPQLRDVARVMGERLRTAAAG
jgi:hypothetical protein